MNKSKHTCKKQLLRFAEQTVPKSVFVQHLPVENPTKTTKTEDLPVESTEKITPILDIAAPRLNSTLSVKKKIKQVEEIKPRKIKSLNDLPNPCKTTYDEKITKKMNFPFDKKLYKELISLKLKERPVLHTVSTFHEPVLRDKVPKLEDFFTPSLREEYNIPPIVTLGQTSSAKYYNGLRLYQVIKTWKTDKPD